MLATPELLLEAAQPSRLRTELARSAAQTPLYGRTHSPANESLDLLNWPFITKRDIRHGFPGNFLGAQADFEDLLEREVIELEHTSGTSEERTALLLPRGWWAEQELRALNLNSSVARMLRDNPQAKRATINSPVCSGDIRYTGVPSQDERTVGNSLFV